MENKKNVILAILIVGVVAMTVAFAALSTNLSISGTANVGDVSWNIHFTNWQLDTESTVTYGGVTHQNTASYPTVNQLLQSPSVAASTKVENLNVTLNQPGDYVKYTFEIINEGSIDATLNNFTYPLTCASGKNCDHLTYVVSCKDNTRANDFVVNSSLNSGERAYCYLQVTYNDQTNNNGVYTQEAVSASVGVNFVFIQKQTGSSQGGNSGSGEQGGSGDIVVPAGSYLITFNANGGSGTMSGQVIDPTVSNTLTTNTYTRSGYKFSGWNTNENGSGTGYTNEQVLSSNTISSNITLYAQWLRNGWEFVNESTWNSSTDDLKDQRWRYYRDGQIVQNELIYVDGTYIGSAISMHYYLIENGYMYVGWHQDGNNNWNFYSWFDLDNNGYVEGYRVEGMSMEIGGETYTFDPNGVSDKSPVSQASQSWDTYYSYDIQNYESIQQSAFDNSWTVWAQANSNEEEACGKFGGVTKCLKYVSYDDYVSQITCTDYDECTANNSTYVKQVVDDFADAGIQCYLYGSGMDCYGNGVTCSINTENEQSNCSNNDYTCAVYDGWTPDCY